MIIQKNLYYQYIIFFPLTVWKKFMLSFNYDSSCMINLLTFIILNLSIICIFFSKLILITIDILLSYFRVIWIGKKYEIALTILCLGNSSFYFFREEYRSNSQENKNVSDKWCDFGHGKMLS